MASAGKDFLIQALTASDTYTTVAGMRSPSLRINGEIVDVTNAGSAGLKRELLAAASVGSMSVTGAGVFNGGAAQVKVEEAARARTLLPLKIVVPDWGTYAGSFQISTFELTGEYNGAVMFSATFESSGDYTFTAVGGS